MLIVCPNCSTSYAIDQASVGTTGRTVRCARCKSTWFAASPNTAQPDVVASSERTVAEAEAPPDPRPDRLPAVAAAPESQSDTAPVPQAEANATAGDIPPPLDGSLDDQSGSGPVVITDAPSLVPPIEHDALEAPSAAANADSEQEDIESFAARRERLQAKRKQRQSRSRWAALILLLLAFNVAVVGARAEVVRYLPQTASLFAMIGLPVNLRHLAFQDVKVSRRTADGAAVLLVEGNIVSKSKKATGVPRLRFAVRNAKGRELYTWTALPGRSVLGAGETLPFHSRLASPPEDAVDIMVRFFNSRDKIGVAK